LALQTRNNASSGGKNLLASSWTVYNEISRTHPHLRELLAQPIWSFDSRGKFLPSNTRPLLYHHANRIIMNFAREPLLGLDGVARHPSLPSLTDEQRRALDVVEEIARRNQVVLEAQRGDLLFVNNHGVLHSREAFEDSAASPRYLVRMWLRNPEMCWDLPRGALRDGNRRIYAQGEGSDEEFGEQWNIVDVPRDVFRLSERLTS
jgi:alpha-ketoglutarate-dependent taurine dioxygenase